MSTFLDFLSEGLESEIPMTKTEEITKRISDEIAAAKEDGSLETAGGISDGYHTFKELYHHRAILFATILNNPMFAPIAWKAKLHEDGSMYDGMFIVGIDTPAGQASYHYDLDPYWDMFKVKELEHAPHFDGYTPAESIERIKSLWSMYL